MKTKPIVKRGGSILMIGGFVIGLYGYSIDSAVVIWTCMALFVAPILLKQIYGSS